MSKLNQESLRRAIHEIKNPDKPRKFVETVELQIGLKDYDPQKDKRFAGQIRLPHVPRPKLSAIILGDQVHADQAVALNLPFVDAEKLKSFNKNRKLIKKFFKSYEILLASESIVKQLPKLVGPVLAKLNKFPISIGHNDNILDKIEEARSTVKYQLKKVLCLGVAVGNLGHTEEQLKQNISLSINYLVSLLKKNWNNIRSLYIKSTMGKSKRIYG
jgi:large subunit ribosomal protein L10Ae